MLHSTEDDVARAARQLSRALMVLLRIVQDPSVPFYAVPKDIA